MLLVFHIVCLHSQEKRILQTNPEGNYPRCAQVIITTGGGGGDNVSLEGQNMGLLCP